MVILRSDATKNPTLFSKYSNEIFRFAQNDLSGRFRSDTEERCKKMIGSIPVWLLWLAPVFPGMGFLLLWRRSEAAQKRVEERLIAMDVRMERWLARLERPGGSGEERSLSVRRTAAGTYAVAGRVHSDGNTWKREQLVEELRKGGELLEVSRRLNVGVGATRLMSKLMELKG